MATDIDICNMALSHLGSGKAIANLNEGTAEAIACRVFIDQAKELVLRDFAWPFASRIISPGVVAPNPSTEWTYAYRYPSDCINIQGVLSGMVQDTRQSRIPFELSSDAAGTLILCGLEDARIKYTSRVSNPTFYPADFVMALSFRLAAYICPRLAGMDKAALQKMMIEYYEYEIRKARANAANERQSAEHPESEFIRARY